MKRKLTMTTLKTITLMAALSAPMAANSQTPGNDSITYMLNLQEVVVKSTAPKTKMKDGAMITRIEGTPLESAGTAEEMLARVPGMMRMGGTVQVIGKGTPIYYINGRRVQDSDELKRLRSHDIRDVEVIANPGAAYDASVSAVVRIKTRRQQGEGLSGKMDINDAQALANGNNNLSSTVNMNYRSGAVDVFCGAHLANDYLAGYRSDMVQETYSDVTHSQRGYFNTTQRLTRLHLNAGVNWQTGDNSSVGLKIERGQKLHNRFGITMDEDIMRDNVSTDHLYSVSDVLSDAPNSFMASAYYSGKLGPWGIDANIDYYTQREKKADQVDEQSLSDNKHVESVSENKNHLFASRLVIDRKAWGGNLKLGGELSVVSRDNLYSIDGIETIAGRQSEVSEQNYALFSEYGLMIPKAGMLTLGMRYEHVSFSFDDHTDASRSISRSIDNFFPSLSFATRIGLLQMQLSYAIKTRRPSYYDLRSEVEYVSRYTLQTGNPTLKNETRHDLTLASRWRFISLSIDYMHMKDAIYDWTSPYDDNGVVLIGMVNFDRPIDCLSAYVNIAPTVGCWTTSNVIGIQKQWLSFNLADPRTATGRRTVSYDKPMLILNSYNTFSLKGGWQLELNSDFYSKAHYRNARLLDNYWNLTAVVQKTLLRDKSLTVRLSCSDIFNTARHDALLDLGNYTLFQSDVFGGERSHYSYHRVQLSVRYAFNATKSKYKGQAAGQDIINRM
ncbi:MAG: TonB-dependent receptor domain-containing protein [Prevotella sp.]